MKRVIIALTLLPLLVPDLVTAFTLSFVEPVPGDAGTPPRYRLLDETGEKVARARRLLDNDAARFILTLHARAVEVLRRTEPETGEHERLLVALQPGGNYARVGLRLHQDGGVVDLPDEPYVVLDLTAKALSHTMLHEGGHALHHLCLRGVPEGPAPWRAPTHTTFTVSDRTTALFEGYAIHFETLWGHFGDTKERCDHYHRRVVPFGTAEGTAAEFYAPVRDMWSYAQTWARYQSVRDGLPAFEGLPSSDWCEAQFAPDRSRGHLKNGGQMVASEGVVACFLFWLSTGRALALGARPGGGLEQAGVQQAEEELLAALGVACRRRGMQADVIDVLDAWCDLDGTRTASAVECFLDVTRCVTVDGAWMGRWRLLYDRSVHLDPAALGALVTDLERRRGVTATLAARDRRMLRQALGPTLPVTVRRVEVSVPVFGSRFPLQFDLNAAGRAEVLACWWIPLQQRLAWLRTREAAPFADRDDFTVRTGIDCDEVGFES